MDTQELIARKYLLKTYKVTFAMLLVGQAQVIVSLQFSELRVFLEKYYFVSLIQFFVSFLSLQLYVFFFNIIQTKGAWLGVFCALWTYESNTLCVMKPAKQVEYLTLGVSVVLVYLVMILSIMYSAGHTRRYVTRNYLILWSERIFVVTSFGIIVCSEMHRAVLEFLMLLVYTLISNVFVVVFATSIRHPEFFRSNSKDWLLIGQLYYLNFYVLFMSFIWTIASAKRLIFANYIR